MKSSKGAEFERWLSKKLSLWWTNNQKDDIFWRSQQSGGRATQRKKQGKTTANQEGDLTAMDPQGQPFIDLISVEAKCGYSDFTIEGEINKSGQKTVFRSFLEQCEREVQGTNRYWWLVVKQDRKKIMLIFSISFATFLRKRKINQWRKKDHLEIRFDQYHLLCVRLDDFLESVKGEELK